jgi:hypothetical protein
MRLAGLKNGNHEQRTRSEGLEGAKGGECYVCDFQTQAEGAKDSAVTLEEPATGALKGFQHRPSRSFVFSRRDFGIGDATFEAFVSSISNRVPQKRGYAALTAGVGLRYTSLASYAS